MQNTTENTVNKQYHNKLGMGIYHLDPRWCSTHEFNRIADLGMVNCYRFTTEAGTDSFIRGCEKASETGAQVWYCALPYYGAKESLSDYMKRNDKLIQDVKAAGLWDTVVGFQWDEPLLHRGHTNENFLEMTKAISETYGKRIFPVFSNYEIVGKRGNIEDPPNFQWLLQKSCSTYITDVAFDNYGYDFRVPIREAEKQRLIGLYDKEFNTAEEVMEYFTGRLLDLIEKPDDVRLWYFPCGYLARLWAGGPLADEDFCTQSLEGFKNLLLKQKNPGGLFTYGYKSWGDRDHLDWWLQEENPDRWDKYIAASKRVCDELKDIDIKL